MVWCSTFTTCFPEFATCMFICVLVKQGIPSSDFQQPSPGYFTLVVGVASPGRFSTQQFRVLILQCTKVHIMARDLVALCSVVPRCMTYCTYPAAPLASFWLIIKHFLFPLQRTFTTWYLYL